MHAAAGILVSNVALYIQTDWIQNVGDSKLEMSMGWKLVGVVCSSFVK